MVAIDMFRIRLSAVWVMLVLTYLLGDVLRIFSGDFQAGEMAGKPAAINPLSNTFGR